MGLGKNNNSSLKEDGERCRVRREEWQASALFVSHMMGQNV